MDAIILLTKYITRTLQENNSRFSFKYMPRFGSEFEQILGKDLRIEIIHVLRRTLKHIHDSLHTGMILIYLMQRIEDLSSGNARTPTHALFLCRDGTFVVVIANFADLELVWTNGSMAAATAFRVIFQRSLELSREIVDALLELSNFLLLSLHAPVRVGRAGGVHRRKCFTDV